VRGDELPALGHESRVLAVLVGPDSGAGRAVCARRDPGHGTILAELPPQGAGKKPGPTGGRTGMNAVLQTRNLVKKFGGFVVTDDVSLSVEQGARHALIGPNGAGKTTLINLLTGFLVPTSGSVMLDGRDVTSMAQHERCRQGLVRTFQIAPLFCEMTVLEAVSMAASVRMGLGSMGWQPAGSFSA